MSRRRYERSTKWSAEPVYRDIALQTLFDTMMSLREWDMEAAGRMAERLAKLTRMPR